MADNLELPPRKIAFIVDGVVKDVLHTNERLANVFLSNPMAVDVTELMAANKDLSIIDFTYDIETDSFTAPKQDDVNPDSNPILTR